MKLRFYAIKDNVVGAFLNPIPLHNDAECIRAVKESVQKPGEFTSRAADLSMYYLFTLDYESGLIVDNNVSFICNVIDYVKENNDGESQ